MRERGKQLSSVVEGRGSRERERFKRDDGEDGGRRARERSS